MKERKMTLTGFKNIVTSCMANGIKIQTTICSNDGTVQRVNPFAKVGKLQSNSFALERETGLSYLEYGKAKNYDFEQYPIRMNFDNGNGYMLIEVEDRGFFGL